MESRLGLSPWVRTCYVLAFWHLGDGFAAVAKFHGIIQDRYHLGDTELEPQCYRRCYLVERVVYDSRNGWIRRLRWAKRRYT
jgi:hypothetical protein